MAKKATGAFIRWCELFGITIKLKKPEVRPDITFLCLIGSFPSRANGMRRIVSLTAEETERWAATIRKHLRERIISPRGLGKLIGKLSFSQTCLFGEFARTQIRCLYPKLHARRYEATSIKYEEPAQQWWVEVPPQHRPRATRSLSDTPDFILHTDASTPNCRIASLLFREKVSPPRVQLLDVSTVPKFWTMRLHTKNMMFGIEMVDPMDIPWMNRRNLPHRSLNLYIDNNNDPYFSCERRLPLLYYRIMVACLWRISEPHAIDI